MNKAKISVIALQRTACQQLIHRSKAIAKLLYKHLNVNQSRTNQYQVENVGRHAENHDLKPNAYASYSQTRSRTYGFQEPLAAMRTNSLSKEPTHTLSSKISDTEQKDPRLFNLTVEV
ncbi:MAG: hypothetical protein EZS28_017693 [Streblomastix strix]|uniref:Uncharacterized protein n=1 Tax=Streblomastix strix TaxID=222440 RepID=A0A5J4VWX6_9EUKA|nr:MAG: hypothetical protein EZS28_017693 [Streblomastix strix]